jgi:uncharacterized damage-inducible protein DinB
VIRRLSLVAAVAVVMLAPLPAAVSAQPAASVSPAAERIAPKDVMLTQIAGIEKLLTGIATEMPADKYEFVPTAGAFRGVRSFAKQIKHAASVHYLVAHTILGERVTSDMADERGPDDVKSKDDVLKYLAESFAALRRAVDSLTDENAFASIKGVFGSAPDTRMGLLMVAVAHTSNHYGQVVEYLRMNGLTPPR